MFEVFVNDLLGETKYNLIKYEDEIHIWEEWWVQHMAVEHASVHMSINRLEK